MDTPLPSPGTYFLIENTIWRITGTSRGKSPKRIYAAPIATITVPRELFNPMVEGSYQERKLNAFYFRASAPMIERWIPINVTTDEDAKVVATALQQAIGLTMADFEPAINRLRKVQEDFANVVATICASPLKA